MKVLYIAACDLFQSGLGIRKKVYSQVFSFNKAGIDTMLITQQENYMLLLKQEKTIQRTLFLSTDEMYRIITKALEEYKIDLVYIRFLSSNLIFYNFIRKISKMGIKIIFEFPCTPYDDSIDELTLEEDKCFRNKLWKYVKFSCNMNNLNKVFHIPSIPIANGVDFEMIPERKENIGSDIILLGVAAMMPWHGFDRIIRGLYNYYKSRDTEENVFIRFVGNGQEYNSYRKLAKELGMDNYITFLGELQGDALTDEFNRANFAIGSLGIHRINLKLVSTIKTKEYCSRGLPFIIAYDEVDFEEDAEFILKCPADETDIDIKRIINFYNKIKDRYDSKKLRQYAEEHFSWDTILQPVIRYINNIK